MKDGNEFGTFVLDSSITIAWFLPDEADTGARNILHDTAENGAWVPMLWAIEVGNALSLAIRRRRISMELRSRALERLGALPICIDRSTLVHAWADTLGLADRFDLTLYDACYLELAQRRRLPLASLDRELRGAAHALGIELLGA
jgi:predicted nucleic acid-binding protein